MKKTLMILGSVFVLLIIAIAVAIGIVAVKGSALNKEGEQYANAAIPAIVSHWDMSELERRASPEFKAVANEGDLEKLFAMYRRLGNLKEYKGCQGSVNMSVTSEHGKVISAAYVASAEFDAGPAEIQLSLVKHADQWQVSGFRVNSKAFLDQPPPPAPQ